jgi:hypothetical protein
MRTIIKTRIAIICTLLLASNSILFSQNSFKTKFENSTIYGGIEVGSKGVKLSILEIGKNAQSNGAFNILKDSSVNTDFISFSAPTFQATLDGFYNLYNAALNQYTIPSNRIFTVVSSGVKMQAEKEKKSAHIKTLVDSFLLRINEPTRRVEVVDVMKEGMLSHIGIIPESRRYTTFLIDIGSGNTKGGYFPDGNLKTFKLFQLNWGTKSTFNATDKNCVDDKSIPNFNKQLTRVLTGAENSEIVYAVNQSGAYQVNESIAISGGIAWAVSNLIRPELTDNSIVSVTYKEVDKFFNKLKNNFEALSPDFLSKNLNIKSESEAAAKELTRIHKVFDQKSLIAGTGLLLKIMRQFAAVQETKQFFLIKNGQVGWVSAYVDEEMSK